MHCSRDFDRKVISVRPKNNPRKIGIYNMNIKKFKRRVQKFFFAEQWCLLVCDSSGKVLRLIVPPKGRIWADPFPVEFEGHYYIFIEQQIGNDNGTLGFIELHENLEYSEFIPVLEAPYHLSYPNVFNVGGVWYMIPETHEHNSIDLYRSDNFPEQWVYDSTLIKDVEAVDTSIVHYKGQWWLFTSIARNDCKLNESLSLFYSKVFPSVTWKSHPMNPVVEGLQNSRMAGKIELHADKGSLTRPAQSCVKEYGEHIVLSEIVDLDENKYQEKTKSVIYPEKELHAVCTHTYNRCGKYLIRDIKTRRYKL